MSENPLYKRLLPSQLRQRIRECVVSLRTKHICGPKRVTLAIHEAAVTCVVRNGAFYIEPFIEHYFRMGFRHIFLLDNGSTDQTISLARKHKNVSIFECTLPIDGYQRLLKRHLARVSIKGGWCLDADIDEFFDYPLSDSVGLGGFLRYLNRKRYTAVVTQLLDMFPDKPLSQLDGIREENLKTAYPYFDLVDVSPVEYRTSELTTKYGYRNEVSDAKCALFFGGIRKSLYQNNCLLTKHSLFLPTPGLDLFSHVHFINGARLADLSCVMLHYKFTSNALYIAMQNRKRFLTNSSGYDNFIRFLVTRPDHQIKQHTAQRYQGPADLVEGGFLFMSDNYREYVNTTAQDRV